MSNITVEANPTLAPESSGAANALPNAANAPSNAADAPPNPTNSDATPSATACKRLIEQRTTPASKKRRRKRIKKTTLPTTEENQATTEENQATAVQTDDENLRLLDRKTRWMSFIYHSNIFWDVILRQVYGEDINMDSYKAIIGRAKIFDNVKSYKYEVIKAMEGHVKTCYEHDSMLKQYDTDTLLHAAFTKTFNASNFLHVWNYMDQYVDVDGSSELGKYFMKNIYINLAMEVKRYLDVVESGGPEADARKKLLAFYDCIPVADIFKDVDKSDFKELENRSRGQRRKRKQPDTSGLTRFMSSGAPPAKAPDGNTPTL